VLELQEYRVSNANDPVVWCDEHTRKSAGELVEECDRPGALNQAIMELGATICTVQVRPPPLGTIRCPSSLVSSIGLFCSVLVREQNPQCAECPVRGSCLAYEEAQTTKPRSSSAVKTDVVASDCSICDLSRLSEWDTLTREVS